jgi:hypothetical protein
MDRMCTETADRQSSEVVLRDRSAVLIRPVRSADVLRNMSGKRVGYGPGTVEYEIALSPEEELCDR